MRGILHLVLAALSLGRASGAADDLSRRLFDFTPVSRDNAVVATIDTIRIPLSELRAYRDTEREHAITDASSLAQKRALLEDLIREYLFVDEAYRSGVSRSPGFQRQMEATRTMILTDFMSLRTAGGSDRTLVQKREAVSGLAERLFAAEPIDISNEAYDLVRRAARAIVATSAASHLGPTVDRPDVAAARLHGLIARTPEAVVVRYEDKTISVHQILALYSSLPPPRPSLDTHAAFLDLIKPLIVPELMAMQAMKEGIAREPAFQNKVIQNQNALLRFQVQGSVEREASDLAEAPATEPQLRDWFAHHLSDYAATGPDNRPIVPTFDEARPRVQGDYSVALRDRLLARKAESLRRQHTVTLHEDVLAAL